MIVAVRSLRRFLQILWSSKAHAGAAAVLVVAFLVISFGSVGILLAEQGEDANIRTAEDALWWTMTTVTTVGYGDRYPVTTGGRAIAAVVMIFGIGLFGTLSGIAASLFVGGDKSEPASGEAQRAMLMQLEALKAELAEERASRSRLAKPSKPPTLDG